MAASDNQLPGLGPKSLQVLKLIGVESRQQLVALGAIEAYQQIQRLNGDFKPSLNLLYALVRAIEQRDWREVAKQEKTRLLTELEAAKERHQAGLD